jgi:hypothetical protein
MESTPALAPRRRRSFRKLSAAELAIVYRALTRAESPASAAAVADVFGLDVSSVHRIRRTYRPPPPVEKPEPVIAFWPWRQRSTRRPAKRSAPLPIF